MTVTGPPDDYTDQLKRAVFRLFTPNNCPHCEYDRKFLGFEEGGWMKQDNNGPIVSCPMCNPDGGKYPRP